MELSTPVSGESALTYTPGPYPPLWNVSGSTALAVGAELDASDEMGLAPDIRNADEPGKVRNVRTPTKPRVHGTSTAATIANVRSICRPLRQRAEFVPDPLS